MKTADEVVAAAIGVFFRYGFRRTTMGDLATAAGMSRPALYLVFPSKEDVFIAVMTRLMDIQLGEIRVVLAGRESPYDKLLGVFDIWAVRPFTMVQSSPDAKDIYESSFQFARAVMQRAHDDLLALVTSVFRPLKSKGPSALQLARMLVAAIPGFKLAAKTPEELRALIGTLVMVTLTGLTRPRRSR